MKRVIKAGALALSLITACGCSSHFSEKQPGAVNGGENDVEARLAQKTELDQRIDKIERAADKLKRILSSYRKIQNPTAGLDVYTPLDFLFEATRELRSKLPTKRSGEFIREATLILKSQSIREECRRVDMFLTETERTDSMRGLTYFIKTCGTNGDFANIFAIHMTSKGIAITIDREQINGLFVGSAKKAALGDQKCDIGMDERNLINSVKCENLDMQISSSESLVVKELWYNTQSDDRLRVKAEVYENDVLKAKSHGSVSRQGLAKFEMKPVDASGKEVEGATTKESEVATDL